MILPTQTWLGPALVRWTDARHGDLGRRSAVAKAGGRLPTHLATQLGASSMDEWVRLRQVHGSHVVVAESVTDTDQEGDALVTSVVGLPLTIATADCVPVAMASENGIVAAVHAGWRSATGGVLQNTSRVMRERGATRILAAVGPFIHAECYEFDPDLLQQLAAQYDVDVMAKTSDGTPALDMRAVIRHELSRADVELVYEDPRCTGCNTNLYSYRKRQSSERHVMLVTLSS